MNKESIDFDHDNKLVFDLGFFDGSDSRYYIDKGFRVVAVEADPRAVERAAHVFRDEIDAGALHLVNKAIWSEGGTTMPFYLHPSECSQWSSLDRPMAERAGEESIAIEVETVTVPMLFDQYGVPRYLKCDLEGSELIVVDQIGADGRRPPFLSIESFECERINRLAAAGYDRFQLVNQGMALWRLKVPKPAREGRNVDIVFGDAHSGPFGLDLPPGHWCDEGVCVARFDRWKQMRLSYGPIARLYKHIGRLTGRTWLDSKGWIDVHATTRQYLATF